jgi:FKBP12-rapamycin complex-associated protein
LAADIVDFEVKRAFEWLDGNRSERRHAAVLVFKELAENTPV